MESLIEELGEMTEELESALTEQSRMLDELETLLDEAISLAMLVENENS